MQQFIDFSLRHWELWLAFIVILILLVAFELRNKLTGVPQLSPHAATLLINRSDAVVLDVRDANSFAKGHIIGAINIPLAELNDKLNQLEKHKTKPIIIAFNTGQSLNKVNVLLQSNGFTQINHLSGGINSWQSAGLPLVKD